MKKRLLALLLALCLLADSGFLSAGARAESFTVYVVSNTLKVYQKVSTASRVLGTMSFGESAVCLATNSGWAAVRNGKGVIGFCKIGGLSNVNPNTYNEKAYINSANVPVYRRPESSAPVMTKLRKGSSYTAVAVTQDKNWTRLKNGKYYGYVQTKYLSRSGQDDSSAQSTTVYVSSNTLKAYKKPSTSSKSLGTMSYGEDMTLLAAANGWARIRNASGAVGYCKLSGLTEVNPNRYSQTMYVLTTGAKAYRKPSTSSSVMRILKKNETYTAVAITPGKSWVRLKNGKYYGYVQTKYLSTAPGEEDTATPVYVSDNVLTIYADASGSGAKLGTLAYGEALTLLNVDDGWAKVSNASGSVGYCAYGGLTRVNPNTQNKPYYAAKDGVELCAQPTEGAKVLGRVNANVSLMAVAFTPDGDWARILLEGGSYAYARMGDLSADRVPEDGGQIEEITPRTAYIAATNLNFYASNDSDSTLIGTMSFGERVTCTGLGGGWVRVSGVSGSVGFCRQDGLSSADPNTEDLELYAQTSGVKVYAKASTGATTLGSLSLNAKVYAVAVSEDQSWVRLKNGSTYGYAETKYFSTSPVENPEENDKISALIALARKQLGVPYKYGAQSPSDGFDCSGFTYYVYKNALGVALKRTAKTQGYDDRYQKITGRAGLKAGDLVFFNTVEDGGGDLCDHVGIYLGGNQFIHASSAKGEVTISSMGSSSSDYYYRTYSWGRRILS